MPQVVVGAGISAGVTAGLATEAAIAGAAFAGLTGASAIFAQSFVTSLVLGGVSMALQGKPKMAEAGLNIGNIKEPVSPRKVIYGETRVGGTYIMLGTSEVVWADIVSSGNALTYTARGDGTFLCEDTAGRQCVTYSNSIASGDINFKSPMRRNEFLHLVFALAGHELTDITDVFYNEEKVGEFSGGSFTLTTDQFNGDLRTQPVFFYKSGGAGQTYISQLEDNIPFAIDGFVNDGVAESVGGWTRNYYNRGIGRCCKYENKTTQPEPFVDWTSDHKCLDTALLYCRLQYYPDAYSTGLPKITAIVKGKSLYDPRTETSAYSSNAALAILDYLRDDKYGLGVTDAEIDWDSFESAANICDEDVALDAGGTEKRYTINGIIDTSLTPRDVLENMLTACAGKLVYVNGKFTLYAAAYRNPAVTIDETQIISPITISTKTSNRSLFNAVKGSFADPNSEPPYTATEYPSVISSAYAAIDGREIYTALDLPFTSSSATAQRLAKLMLNRSRQEISVSFKANLSTIDVAVGDTIQITNTRLGFSSKTFEVTSSELGMEADGSMYMSISAQEVTASTFDWTASDEQAIINNTAPYYRDYQTPAPTDLAFTASAAVEGDGTVIVNWEISWTRSSGFDVSQYEVQWKSSSQTNYLSTYTAETGLNGTGQVISGDEYTFRVRAITKNGAYSEFATTTYTMPGDTTAPATPTGLTASGGIGFITLDWTGNTEVDLKGYIVYENSTNNSGTATAIASVSADQFARGGLPYETTKYYWVSAIDFSGNESAKSSVASATTLAQPQDGADGADGATGPRNAQVYFYYNTAQASAPTAPTTAQVAYNFSTQTPTISASGWSATFNPSASSDDDTGANKYWAVKVVFQENTFGGSYSETISSVFTWLNFDGLVTFTNLANGTNENGSTSTTLIDGGAIQTGTLTADKIASGTATISSGNTFEFGTNTTVDGQPCVALFNGNGKHGVVGHLTTNQSGVAAVGWIESGTGAGSCGVYGPTLGTLTYGTFHGLNGVAQTIYKPKTTSPLTYYAANIFNSAYAMNFDAGSGKMYVPDGYLPFTGVHIGVISGDVEIGDIVVDKTLIEKTDISNTKFEVEVSNGANSKRAIGVAAKIEDSNLYRDNLLNDAKVGARARQLTDAESITLDDLNMWVPPADTNIIDINALGEGQINVCGEGGDIEAGDLIVTSSIPGKGMKQADDLVRNYTVAKAREAVTFTSPTEVKQIACIYMCG